jgi:ABC-type multidrug transport system permease subunit
MSVGIFQIIAIVVFILSSSAANITFVQRRKPLSERMGAFRDGCFLDLLYLPASLFLIGSSIYLLISSWVLFLIVAGSTIVLTPILINRLVLRFIIGPTYMIIVRLAEKKETEGKK